MTTEQHRLVLTDEQLQHIHAVIETADAPGAEGTVAFWSTAVPEVWDAVTADNRLNPTEYAIPDDQWRQVCQWIVERAEKVHPNDASVSAPLTFVNVGPSSYKREHTS